MSAPSRRGLVLAATAVLALARAVQAQPVSTTVKLDNLGYRAGDTKVVIFTQNPGASVQVRDGSNAVVFTIPTSGGSITAKGSDAPDSPDTVWWVDFTPFAAPGSYHLFSPSLNVRSYTFDVKGDAYREVVRAALKSFYYQRCGTPKPAAHASGNWQDAACHLADRTTGPASGQTNFGIKDLSGGWHDAGDYNKYMWSADSNAILFLLHAYEENPAFRFDDLNIPESGNGIPDVLDEVRWELDWILKMQLPDGRVLGRTHVPTFESDSPPSADTNIRSYYNPNMEAAGVFAGCTALAARVYAAAGQAGYAAVLKAAALRTWTWLLTQGNDPSKAWAAAEVFRMDPTLTSARDYVNGFHPGNWSGVFFNVVAFDTQAALTYIQTPAATASVVANMRTNVSDQVNYVFSEDDLYRNGMPDWSYYWGSNAIRAGYGAFLLKAAQLGNTGSHTADETRRHALDFLHFFHGQNTLNMAYLSNLVSIGGEHSSFQFYHSWFGFSGNAYSRTNFIGKPAGVLEPAYPYFAGTDNHGINDNKSSTFGPAPGFVVGGPNTSYGGDAVPPRNASGFNRAYRDWNEQSVGDVRTWEITENSIGYQGPYVGLGAAFMAAAFAQSLSVDAAGNGVFEPGETVVVAPTRYNATGAPLSLTGTAGSFGGPLGPTYTIADGAAAWGPLAPGASAGCGANCYALGVTTQRPTTGNGPLTHWDATLSEATSTGEDKTWKLHVGESFSDVPRAHPFYRFVEILLHHGITSGCNATQYCPSSPTTREQMAVFMLAAREGDAFSPPACGTPLFTDVPASSPYCRFIEELARRGVVGGCAPGLYCPGSAVTRDQMAVFALRTLDPALDPPACATPPFDDVPTSSPFCKWIAEMARRGIVGGCGGGNYCASSPVTRDQMGVFITGTFGLTLY